MSGSDAGEWDERFGREYDGDLVACVDGTGPYDDHHHPVAGCLLKPCSSLRETAATKP